MTVEKIKELLNKAQLKEIRDNAEIDKALKFVVEHAKEKK